MASTGLQDMDTAQPSKKGHKFMKVCKEVGQVLKVLFFCGRT